MKLLVEKILKEAYFDDIFYHGTSTKKAAESILKNGLQPPDLGKRKNMLTPMMGKVYLSRNLPYAIIYSIGGDMLGHKLPDKWILEEPFGYLFIAERIDDKNVLPDEDIIGELIYSEKIPELTFFAKTNLTSNQFKKVMEGEYNYWAAVGKKLNKIMPSNLKDMVLKQSHAIAHEGEVKIVEAWKFDKNLCPELKNDGSNFFELAEKIKFS